MQVVLGLQGRGVLYSDEGEYRLAAGETLLLPAALSRREFRPHGLMSVLVATLPDPKG